MKENQRVAAALDLRVRQLNLPNLSLPGESNNHTGMLQRSVGVATFGNFRPKWMIGLPRILLTGRYDRFCANLPCGPVRVKYHDAPPRAQARRYLRMTSAIGSRPSPGP
jgi:hypothetical protein